MLSVSLRLAIFFLFITVSHTSFMFFFRSLFTGNQCLLSVPSCHRLCFSLFLHLVSAMTVFLLTYFSWLRFQLKMVCVCVCLKRDSSKSLRFPNRRAHVYIPLMGQCLSISVTKTTRKEKKKKKKKELNEYVIKCIIEQQGNVYLCELVWEWPYLVVSMCWGLEERWLLAVVVVVLFWRSDALLLDSANSVSVWFWTCRT